MTVILIVEKNGTLKEQPLKEFKASELYKKAGLKNGEGFGLQTTWTFQNNTVELYAKATGRAGQENKYDFPPPVDTKLFFGSCVLVRKKDSEVVDLTEKDWEKAYEHLFGGFEDVGSEDSEDEEEEEENDLVVKTKEGYEKDGFVVDDEEEDVYEDETDEEEDQDDEDEEYSEDEIVTKKKNTKAKQQKKKTTTKKKKEETVFNMKVAETYLDCTSELSEESYV